MQDSKQIDELFRLMDDVCENGDAALPALEQYLQTQTDAPEIDTEASLKKFKADHKEFFVKPHRGRRLCYRVFVVAAAVFAAGTVRCLVLCGQRDCGQHAEQHDQHEQERQNSFFHLYVLSQYM